MTDSLLPGTLDTACLRPVNKNRVFGIGVVETVLFESQTGGSTFELVMATGGLSGGLSMRY